MTDHDSPTVRARSRGFGTGFARDWDGDLYFFCDDPESVSWTVTFTKVKPDGSLRRDDIPLETGLELLTRNPRSPDRGGWESISHGWCIDSLIWEGVCHLELEITDTDGATETQLRKTGASVLCLHED